MSESSVGALVKALAAAKLEMGPLHKNAQNPHLRNRFADLAAVMDTITGPLARHGLALTQATEVDERGNVVLVSTLWHEGGGSLPPSRYPVAATGNKGVNDSQALGAGVTYARRYSAMALLGLAPEDDDGCSAPSPRRAPPQRQAPPQKPTADEMSRAQGDFAAWVETMPFDLDAVTALVAQKGERLIDLPPPRLAALRSFLETADGARALGGGA